MIIMIVIKRIKKRLYILDRKNDMIKRKKDMVVI